MKNYIKAGLMVFVFVVIFSGCILAEESKPVLAPDFQLQDTRQDVIKLSSYKDEQPVVLFFWTTWCPFCQKELRILNERYAGLVQDGFEVLAINVGESPDSVENFIRSYYLAYRVLLDKDTAVAKAYEIIGVPTYILINEEGNIVFKDNYFPQQYKEFVSKP